MARKTVLMLRRTEDELTTDERDALQKAFPGDHLTFITRHPTTAVDHAADCQAYKPTIVLLPLETPIPDIALKAGVQHVVARDGKLYKLVAVNPEFEPF